MRIREWIIGLIYIDNYEEILDDIDAVKRSMLIAVADRKIEQIYPECLWGCEENRER